MENTQKVAYVRVSTEEQNDARQREALASYGIDRFFIDHASGKTANRPQHGHFCELRPWASAYTRTLSLGQHG